jgi:hypothetical protein
MAVRNRARGPTQRGITVGATRCTKGGCKQIIGRRMPGAGLSRRCVRKAPLESQPSSRTGENPPYGMIGGIEETSASFEARYAPRSYPTTYWHGAAVRDVRSDVGDRGISGPVMLSLSSSPVDLRRHNLSSLATSDPHDTNRVRVRY